MQAHVLSIGSELLQGHLTDTNATFLAQEISALGIELVHVTQVGDDLSRLVATLRSAAAGCDLVVCTGGVGPTDDDLTREAVAEMVGETPIVDAELLDRIRAYFAGRGLSMPNQNAKQAWRIPSSEIMDNPVGTAPGWFVRHDGGVVVTMPGVPREMFRMWRDQAVPRLSPLLPARVVRSAVLKTIGIGESAAARVLDDLIKRGRPIVATYAKDDGVQVRFTSVGTTEAEADLALQPVLDESRRRLRRFVYGEGDGTLPSAILRLLGSAELQLGVAEVGTGGRFAALMLSELDPSTSIVGATTLPAGSRESWAAEHLAKEARQRFGAGLGLAAVATFETAENGVHPASITIAVNGTVTAQETFPLRAAFAEVQRRAALHAADVLWRTLIAQ